jgi:LysR substrate binding domain-containing protein
VTLLPELSVATEVRLPDLRVRAFARPAPGRTIGLVWRKRSPLATALRRVAATVKGAYPRTGSEKLRAPSETDAANSHRRSSRAHDSRRRKLQP